MLSCVSKALEPLWFQGFSMEADMGPGKGVQFGQKKLCTLYKKEKIKIQHLKNMTITIQLCAILSKIC